MRREEAVEILRPAVRREDRMWVDLGAGDGLFADALLYLLDQGARVVAVERDAVALTALRRLAARPDHARRLSVVEADLGDARWPTLEHAPADGVLLANVLHYFQYPTDLLRAAGGLLAGSGRMLVVEYTGRAASPWVPYPLPPEELARCAAGSGFASAEVVHRRPSAFGGTLYAALLERGAPRTGPSIVIEPDSS